MTTISEKVAHVLHSARGVERTPHHCHWTGCEKPCPPAMWGCRRHWYMLPADLRAKIWKEYRPGQEQTKTPSAEYVEVAREVQDWIAANHPPQPKQEN